ncbi:MAG: hypothetical protein HYX69_06655 [Planctomycetia bacterium]|nr:hypothetical protein [Planctomycetia bacterium]
MRPLSVCALWAACWSANIACGSVVWDESVNGDLSGNRLAPTAIAIAVGDNELVGSVKGGELDYVTFTVPAGAVLSKLVLESFTSTDQIAFIAIQNGATFTEPAVGTVTANLLGYTHFGPGEGNVGTDILDDMGTGAGAQGFTPPLPAGAYALWIQQLSSLTSYQFDFVVSNVPEPSAAALAGGAVAVSVVIAGWRRPRKRVKYRAVRGHSRAAAFPAACPKRFGRYSAEARRDDSPLDAARIKPSSSAKRAG